MNGLDNVLDSALQTDFNVLVLQRSIKLYIRRKIKSQKYNVLTIVSVNIIIRMCFYKFNFIDTTYI